MLQSHSLGPILHLQLARPPANAFNRALLETLRDAIASAPAQGHSAILLSGSPGMFSGGMDVVEMQSLDHAGVTATWGAFFATLRAMVHSPLPIAVALTGHSPAGGAVLSLFADYRVMAQGPYKIGLNEVQVGLYVPAAIQYALRRLVGSRQAERLYVGGLMIDPAHALTIGMVDELAALDAVVERARVWLQSLLSLPQQAMRRTRETSRQDLRDALEHPELQDLSRFVDGYFAEETQTVLRALVAKLNSKKAN
jgi:Delta3-Delta2-enoyl-CoA isomerase